MFLYLSYIYWVDPKVERAYKRLVRDRLHYHDDIFCLAGKSIAERCKVVLAHSLYAQYCDLCTVPLHI
jgi:hypothetical protein